MTSRKATGNPRSSFAHQMAPSTIALKPRSLRTTRIRLSVKISCRRRLTTPASVDRAKSAIAIAAMR